MKLKRYIALLLCALYVSATAGTALASLTCKCLGMKAPVEHSCTGCCHLSENGGADLQTACPECSLRTRCGCELHSTEIDLYTSSHSDDSEKYVRCIVAELPPSLAAECPCPAHVPALRHALVLPPVPLVREMPGRVCGLRAPPAWV